MCEMLKYSRGEGRVKLSMTRNCEAIVLNESSAWIVK